MELKVNVFNVQDCQELTFVPRSVSRNWSVGVLTLASRDNAFSISARSGSCVLLRDLTRSVFVVSIPKLTILWSCEKHVEGADNKKN